LNDPNVILKISTHWSTGGPSECCGDEKRGINTITYHCTSNRARP